MKFEEFRDRLFAIAREKGCDAETYCTNTDKFAVNILEGETDSYSVSLKIALSLKVRIGNKTGYAYTEVFDEPEKLFELAYENALTIETEDDSPMQGKCEYQSVTMPEVPLLKKSAAEKIELAKKLEVAAKAKDPRVMRMAVSQLTTVTGVTSIDNTLGLHANRDDSMAYIVAGVIMKNGEELKNSYAYRINAEAGNYDSAAQEAVSETASRFGGSPVASGEYRILFRNTALSDLMSAFFPMFSAAEAQKGLSLLNGKEGTKICSDKISITDDPFNADYPRAFDDEGTPSVITKVVEKGVLKSLLHNLKTAKKAGVQSTSNGGKASVAAPVDISPSVFYIENGDKSIDELMSMMGDGLYITDLSGLHAGVNPVSGEFSLLAEGFLVEKGKIVRPVERVTVAGTFLGVLSNVVALGSDFKLNLPGDGVMGAPSLLVSEMMVSGS